MVDSSKGKYSADPEVGHDLAILLGDVLATASCTWTSGRAAEVAKAIKESVDEEGEYGRTTVLNAMLGGHDHDGDHVTDLVYGADFLVELGRELESIDWNTISVYAGLLNSQDKELKSQAESWLGPAINAGPSFDPLAGVLYAMVPNGQAALTFLEPNVSANTGNDENVAENDDAERVKRLMGRHELGETLWTETWTGLANHTSTTYAGEYADEDHPPSVNAKRAAALAATVVDTIGENTNKVTEAARKDLTEVLTTYPWSVDQAARGGGASQQPIIAPEGTDVKGNDTWVHGMSCQPQFTAKGLAGVKQAISRDNGDFRVVADSVAALEQRRMIFEADAINTATDGQGIDTDTKTPVGLQNAIQANSATAAFFLGANRAVAEAAAADKDSRNKMIVDVLFCASSFIPGPGGGASQLAKDAWSFGKDAAKVPLKNAATNAFAQNLAAAIGQSGTMKNDDKRAVATATITQMIGLGIIPADQANAVVSELVRSDGTIDFSKLDGSALDSLYTHFVPEASDAVNPGLYQGLQNAGYDYDRAYERGQGK